MVAAVAGVVDARGDMPGRVLVPLHVGVVGEELAVLVEGHVVLVAETDREEFDRFAVAIGAGDVAAGGVFVAGMAAGIPHTREEAVLAPGDNAGPLHRLGEIGVVAVGEVDRLAVGERTRACVPCSPEPFMARRNSIL
ncbi:MAG: hypothetical protein JNK23_00390 [Opitutaceae bacterium]|nr:hypothetical protein [Opitutaceae bacterium]